MNRDLLSRVAMWSPSDTRMKIVTIDAHTAGEPLRVLVAGYPTVVGRTILQRRRFFREVHDEIRTALMWEPRGHADMYGCIVVPPERPESHFGVIFIHNDGYSTMCGHGIIGVATIAVETGLVARTGDETVIRIDTPAGLVVATVHATAERVVSVSFVNVPSFVDAFDEVVGVPGLGIVCYDLAFGGAYYAYVEAAAVGLTCTTDRLADLVHAGRQIKEAIAQTRPIEHPEEGDLGYLYGVIFTGPAGDPANHSRNVCVFADGEVDRSPTGTGVSGRAAIHAGRGELQDGDQITIESILGTTFDVRVVGRGRCGRFEAVIPEVSGSAYLTGRAEHWIDPTDPLATGFLLR